MAGKPTKKKPIEQYEHKGKERLNNPPVGPTSTTRTFTRSCNGRGRPSTQPLKCLL